MKPQMTASRWIIDPPPPPAKPLTDDERLDKIITFLEGAYGFACEAAEPEAFCVADTLRSIEQQSESKLRRAMVLAEIVNHRTRQLTV